MRRARTRRNERPRAPVGGSRSRRAAPAGVAGSRARAARELAPAEGEHGAARRRAGSVARRADAATDRAASLRPLTRPACADGARQAARIRRRRGRHDLAGVGRASERRRSRRAALRARGRARRAGVSAGDRERRRRGGRRGDPSARGCRRFRRRQSRLGCAALFARVQPESRALAERNARVPGGRGRSPVSRNRCPTRRAPARSARCRPSCCWHRAGGACCSTGCCTGARGTCSSASARPDAVAGWGEDAGLVEWQRGHTYADPFLFERDGHHHLFVEDVAPGTDRGVISHVELRPGNDPGTPVPILQADHHLSYPFVFSHGGEVYMIPETGDVSQIRLYRAARFPTEWELDRVLVDDIRAADATLIEAEGRWWMFATVGGRGTTLGDELHLFLAGSPLGPWAPHPANPIVSDVRAARPAGAILRDGDRLVRPGAGRFSTLRLGGLAARDHRAHARSLRGTRDRTAPAP